MIYTSPDKLLRIFGPESPFGRCCLYLSRLDTEPLAAGEKELPGGIRVIQKPGDPLKREGRCEAHRKYIDIQLVTKGEELVKAAPLDACAVLEEYDPAGDIEWLAAREEYTLLLKPGRLLVLFPWDAHMPSLMPDPEHTRTDKIIFKVPLF
ncbi:MAG: YhcH/YjgK/YiaL family protein [Abditibacteriota bacterium]|nr:YhcH/YjgK/YiaL family protein [Abditibacteriota bacterium]